MRMFDSHFKIRFKDTEDSPESPKRGGTKVISSARGKGKKIDLEDCVTEYDIMDADGCLIGSGFHKTVFNP